MPATASGAPNASANPPSASAPNGCETDAHGHGAQGAPRSSGEVPCRITAVCSTAKPAKPKPPTNRIAIERR